PTELYPLSLHDALPIFRARGWARKATCDEPVAIEDITDAVLDGTTDGAAKILSPTLKAPEPVPCRWRNGGPIKPADVRRECAKRSEEHTSELQSRGHLV